MVDRSAEHRRVGQLVQEVVSELNKAVVGRLIESYDREWYLECESSIVSITPLPKMKGIGSITFKGDRISMEFARKIQMVFCKSEESHYFDIKGYTNPFPLPNMPEEVRFKYDPERKMKSS